MPPAVRSGRRSPATSVTAEAPSCPQSRHTASSSSTAKRGWRSVAALGLTSCACLPGLANYLDLALRRRTVPGESGRAMIEHRGMAAPFVVGSGPTAQGLCPFPRSFIYEANWQGAFPHLKVASSTRSNGRDCEQSSLRWVTGNILCVSWSCPLAFCTSGCLHELMVGRDDRRAA